MLASKLKILSIAGLHKQVERIKLGKCPVCGKDINYNEFRDEISRREYDISGMCQLCQDEAFIK